MNTGEQLRWTERSRNPQRPLIEIEIITSWSAEPGSHD
jgi:hypothetical protein